MTVNLFRYITAVPFLCVLACGAPGAYDLCRAECDGIAHCGYRTDGQTASCHAACDQNQAAYAAQDMTLSQKCKNAADIRRQELGCYNSTPCGATSASYLQSLMSCSSAEQPGNCIKP